jgi:phage-related protein
MQSNNEIGLEAVFKDDDFQRGVEEYNKSTENASKSTEQAGDMMGSIWEGLAKVGEIAFQAIAVGVAAMAAELYLAVDAAMDAEEVFARMEFIVENVGERTGVAAEDVLEMADALSQIVPIDDEVITSAITMGLTFDGVTKDNIEPLLAAAADLATFTGKDLPATMKTLALAISDPERAMRLFRDANITLTDAEKKTLEGFKETGDTAGATQFILEQLAKKGILGLAEAMGKTAKGEMTIMKTAIGNLQEALGSGLLESLSGVFEEITAFASDPKTIAFFTDLGAQLGTFAGQVLDSLPSLTTMVQGIGDWLAENKPLIIGVLAAIGVAMAAFAISVVVASAAAIEAILPIIAIMAAVGLAVAFLTKAWTEDWGGIQTAVKKAWKKMQPTFDILQKWLEVNIPKAIELLADVWEDVLLPSIEQTFKFIGDVAIPILVELVEWVGENLPKALKTSSDFWSNVLLPAIRAISNFINGTLIPIFSTLTGWLSSTLTAALKNLSGIWTGTLLPAITAVYGFISSYIIPLFNALSNLVSAVVGVAVTAMSGIWQNVLLPALRSVWSFIQGSLSPAFQAVANIVNGTVRPAIEALGNWLKNTAISLFQPFVNWLNGTFKAAWDGIKQAIQFVIDTANKLSTLLNNITLPDWMTPGSPTPWEIGLKGVNDELKRMTSTGLPNLQHELTLLASVRDVSGMTGAGTSAGVNNTNTSTRTNMYGVQFNIPGPTGFIESLQGL